MRDGNGYRLELGGAIITDSPDQQVAKGGTMAMLTNFDDLASLIASWAKVGESELDNGINNNISIQVDSLTELRVHQYQNVSDQHPRATPQFSGK
jgi:hypothetical protein